jgi:CheY-like chemotaxis protein
MPITIYYLDDEPDLLELFVETFSQEGRVVRGFVSVSEFLEEVAKSPPHIVFLDYRLPRITGDEVALRLPPSLPKVLLSGELQPSTRADFYALMQKPFKAQDIESLIAALSR